jgi:hypothetical protein
MDSTCAVCGSKISAAKEVSIGATDHGYDFSCPRCGDYQIDSFTDSQVRDQRLDLQSVAVLSHWIRTEHESMKRRGRKDPIILSEKLVDDIIKNPRPSIVEQADNLVRWLGDSMKAGGDRIKCSELALEAIVGSATSREFLLVFNHLKDQGIITGDRELDKASPAGFTQIAATLSFVGWERYRELKCATSDSHRAFMAMQYDNEQLADIFEDVFRDAVAKTGFDLSRLIDIPQPAGLIDDDLRVKIRASRLLIADLTDKNPGAYWEAGYAEGLGKPVIYTCEKKVFENPTSRPHFDTNHHLTILWEYDPDKRKETAEKLKATIRATLPAEAKLTDD